MDPEIFKEIIEKLYNTYSPSKRKTDPWEEIVLTILSQNTNDGNRDRAFKRLWNKYKTPNKILEADKEEIEELIGPAGLASSKTQYLKNAARYIREKHEGDTDWIKNNPPKEVHRELTSIKGIGHKTADVVLMFSADADLCPVDTHVYRVSKRLGIADGSKKKVRQHLQELRDYVDLDKTHLSLIAHGRNTCKARSPLCSECIVEEKCEKIGVED